VIGTRSCSDATRSDDSRLRRQPILSQPALLRRHGCRNGNDGRSGARHDDVGTTAMVVGDHSVTDCNRGVWCFNSASSLTLSVVMRTFIAVLQILRCNLLLEFNVSVMFQEFYCLE